MIPGQRESAGEIARTRPLPGLATLAPPARAVPFAAPGEPASAKVARTDMSFALKPSPAAVARLEWS